MAAAALLRTVARKMARAPPSRPLLARGGASLGHGGSLPPLTSNEIRSLAAKTAHAPRRPHLRLLHTSPNPAFSSSPTSENKFTKSFGPCHKTKSGIWVPGPAPGKKNSWYEALKTKIHTKWYSIDGSVRAEIIDTTSTATAIIFSVGVVFLLDRSPWATQRCGNKNLQCQQWRATCRGEPDEA